ncbi:MAG: EamA family transporter [Chloroflexi bacterium]|nr:EamA family transporter [Chloroflexota bacterium]
MPPIAFILASVLLGVMGQILLKAGVGRIGPLALEAEGPLQIGRRIITSLWIWAGLILYGVGTFFWLLALSRVELSYAYPFISLSYVLIAIGSWLLFREEISWMRLLGILAICLGVYAVAGGIFG